MTQQTTNALQIELVYDRDCPNVDDARAMIRAALAEVGAEIRWTEWDREDARTPERLRNYGSPTVLVNGRDVGCDENELTQSDANSCRVYLEDDESIGGAPSSKRIASAIREQSR
jgi:mercuric ion transport protein